MNSYNSKSQVLHIGSNFKKDKIISPSQLIQTTSLLLANYISLDIPPINTVITMVILRPFSIK